MIGDFVFVDKLHRPLTKIKSFNGNSGLRNSKWMDNCWNILVWLDYPCTGSKYQCVHFQASLNPCITFQSQPKYSSLLHVMEKNIEKGAIVVESNYRCPSFKKIMNIYWWLLERADQQLIISCDSHIYFTFHVYSYCVIRLIQLINFQLLISFIL